MTVQDKILKSFLDSNKKTSEALIGINNALDKINDQNVLHCETINKNTDKLIEMVSANKSIIKIFQWVLVALVTAIIVLAGAEKAITLIPKL